MTSGIRDLSRSDCFYSRRHDVKCHTDCAHRGGYQHCEYQLRPSKCGCITIIGMLVGTPAGVTAAAAPGTIAERDFTTISWIVCARSRQSPCQKLVSDPPPAGLAWHRPQRIATNKLPDMLTPAAI